jgi:hypothetical protein
MSLKNSLFLIKKSNTNKGNSSSSKHSHFFALCKTCFWTATILQRKKRPEVIVRDDTDIDITIMTSCPICSDDKVSLVPLVKEHDTYKISSLD